MSHVDQRIQQHLLLQRDEMSQNEEVVRRDKLAIVERLLRAAIEKDDYEVVEGGVQRVQVDMLAYQ